MAEPDSPEQTAAKVNDMTMDALQNFVLTTMQKKKALSPKAEMSEDQLQDRMKELSLYFPLDKMKLQAHNGIDFITAIAEQACQAKIDEFQMQVEH